MSLNTLYVSKNHPKQMKIVAISDTHGQHEELLLPPGDVLIHAGDVSGRGYSKEIKKFIKWFAAQPYEYKIFISGNHDFFFEQKLRAEIEAVLHPDIIYLNDSGISIDGINFWGSPVQPWFLDWAFNRQRGEDIDKHWNLIPSDTDVLITHGPPYGILDRTFRDEQVGCEMLLKKIEEVKPKLSIFGHIHEGYGIAERGGTTFVNASVLNLQYQLVNEPIVIEI